MDNGLMAVVERFSRARLLVLGDLRVERVIQGEADRDARGGWRMRGASRATQAGGAAAVACAAAALGAQVSVAGVLGQDAESGEMLRLLAEAGVDPFGIVTAPGMRTAETLLVRLTGSDQPCSRLEIEMAPPPPLEGEPAQAMLAHIEPLLARVDGLLIIAPQSLAPEVLLRASEVARGKGKVVIGVGGPGALPPCDLVIVGADQMAGDAVNLMAERGHGAAISAGGESIAVYAAGAPDGECMPVRAECDPAADDSFTACVAVAAASGAEPAMAARIAVAAMNCATRSASLDDLKRAVAES